MSKTKQYLIMGLHTQVDVIGCPAEDFSLCLNAPANVKLNEKAQFSLMRPEKDIPEQQNFAIGTDSLTRTEEI